MANATRNTRNTRATQPAAPAPATQPAAPAPAATQPAAPAPATGAATKYTRNLATMGATVTGLQPGAVATFGAVTVNGRPVFAKFTGTFTATFTPKLAATSYAFAVWHAISGQSMPGAVALALVAAATQPGAVPAKYSASYAAVAAWLQGTGTQPGATHIVNCALHLKGYLQGYMLHPRKGGMQLK